MSSFQNRVITLIVVDSKRQSKDKMIGNFFIVLYLHIGLRLHESFLYPFIPWEYRDFVYIKFKSALNINHTKNL